MKVGPAFRPHRTGIYRFDPRSMSTPNDQSSIFRFVHLRLLVENAALSLERLAEREVENL